MHDWFGANARMRAQYETALRGVTVEAAIRQGRCYLKHGTSIAVRLFVIDKLPGKAPPPHHSVHFRRGATRRAPLAP